MPEPDVRLSRMFPVARCPYDRPFKDQLPPRPAGQPDPQADRLPRASANLCTHAQPAVAYVPEQACMPQRFAPRAETIFYRQGFFRAYRPSALIVHLLFV